MLMRESFPTGNGIGHSHTGNDDSYRAHQESHIVANFPDVSVYDIELTDPLKVSSKSNKQAVVSLFLTWFI